MQNKTKWLLAICAYIAVLPIYGYFFDMARIPIALVIGACMLMTVAIINHGDKDERAFSKKCMGGFIVACVAFMCLSWLISPAAALSIHSKQSDGQLIFEFYDGEAPYDIWVNDNHVGADYPAAMLYWPALPGESYHVYVNDSAGNTAEATVKSNYYTYDMQTWLLIILIIALIIVSIKIMYAAFGACALSGLLLYAITANIYYTPILRIIPALLFLASLGTFFIHGDEH